jgi:signal transduction histidine kinase
MAANYSCAIAILNQLMPKTDFEIKNDLNNMTHEFKTPLLHINLALDAIKNPKK